MSATVHDVARLRSIAERLLGLHLDDARDDALLALLERRSTATRAIPATYLDGLETGRSTEEVAALASELTVGETYFYRHIEQLRAFTHVALADRAELHGDSRRVRILCAGCASGEEPFSLAMLARESGLELGAGAIRAVDANPVALGKAARATYSMWALRETPPASRTQWFTSVGSEHVVQPFIRDCVRFEQRNLGSEDEELGTPGSYDIVFCRNVLMYFAPARMRAVVERLTTLIAPGGYLFLGHAENLRGLNSTYHLHHSHGAFYYQRKDGRVRARTVEEADTSRVSAPGVAWVDTIRDASERVRRLTEIGISSIGPQPVSGIGEALELARVERYADALRVLGPAHATGAEDVDVTLFRAALLTHNGNIVEAESECRSALAVDEMHAGAHYLLALCREAVGDLDGAAEHDRMAAHLDPAFAMPRLHLGMAARRRGSHEAARAELSLALELLHREDPARILLFGGGFAREALLALCRGELRACGGRA